MNVYTSPLSFFNNRYTFHWHKPFLYLYYIISYLLYQYPLTCFLSKNMDLFIEPLRDQFLGLFFRFCHFLHFISNLLLLCYLLHFHCFLIFWFLFFIFSSFFCFFSSHFFFSFSFFSSSFCFCYPNFLCFGLYCFPHFSEYLVIFISSIIQSISGL